jgi:hypothetical protein
MALLLGIGFLGSDLWDRIFRLMGLSIGANRPQDTGGKSTAASSNFEGFGQNWPAQAAPLI